MGTTAEKLQALRDIKYNIKQALISKGKIPTEVFNTYPEIISELSDVIDEVITQTPLVQEILDKVVYLTRPPQGKYAWARYDVEGGTLQEIVVSENETTFPDKESNTTGYYERIYYVVGTDDIEEEIWAMKI